MAAVVLHLLPVSQAVHEEHRDREWTLAAGMDEERRHPSVVSDDIYLALAYFPLAHNLSSSNLITLR